ncbi:acyltransferase [Salinicoccus albus]|uniref:acyltransferase n=1 Tax=Salinicoccus albus TaxID=418756 RepID=UPI0003784066|nr:acyltransferase [Salinicoccus albus]
MNDIIKIFNQLRYNIPVSLISTLTGFLPDNRYSVKIRGKLLKPFLKSCGSNFQIGRDVTLLNTNNIYIGDNVYIAKGTWLNCNGGMHIGNEVLIAPYVTISTQQHTYKNNSYRFGESMNGKVVIEDGSWITSHCSVKQGVNIGKGSLVAANSSVIKDVDAYTVVGGVPAKFIKSLSNNNEDSI